MGYQIKDKTITYKLISVGLGIGALFWIVESFLEVFVLHKGAGLLDHILLSEPHVIWHRSIVMILLIMFASLSYSTVTRHKKSAEALRKERDIAQKYLDIAGVMMVVIDADQTVSLINKKGCEILGYNEEEVIRKNWFDNFIPEEIRNNVKAVFEMLMSGEITLAEYYENPVLTKSGEEKIVEWHNAVLTDKEGNPISILCSGENITERKKAEVKYKTIIDTTADGFWIIDTKGNFLDVNKAYSHLVGYNRDELLKMNIKAIEAMESRDEIGRHIQRVTEIGNDRFETRHRRKDGSFIDFEVSVNYMDIDGGRLFVFLRDITERKLTEELILQSKLDWESTFNL